MAAFFFLFSARPATSLLFRMEVAVYRYAHILPDLKTVRVPKDSYTSGYFAFLVLATALALCIWALLRVLRHARLTSEILRSVAEIVALAAAPVWWFCATYSASRRDGWNPFTAVQFYEVVLVLVCAILYLSGKWPIPEWGSILIVLVHYGFWFWQFGPYPFFMGYGGPVAPAMGLCSTLAWVFYVRGIEREPTPRPWQPHRNPQRAGR